MFQIADRQQGYTRTIEHCCTARLGLVVLELGLGIQSFISCPKFHFSLQSFGIVFKNVEVVTFLTFVVYPEVSPAM